MPRPGPGQPTEADRGVVNVVIAAGGTESGRFDVDRFRSGSVLIPADLNGDTITFKGASSIGGTLTLISDSTGLTGATGWMTLPAGVFPFAEISLVTGTATAAEAALQFSLKT